MTKYNTNVTIGLHLLRRHVGLPRLLFLFLLSQKPMYDMISSQSRVRYDLVAFLCTIRSGSFLVYDINLGATHTTIPSTRGVQIPIDLVSSATDSIRRLVVLFKHVRIPTSDPKSEFLYQIEFYCAQSSDFPLNHLVRLGYLPHPHHHVSPVLPQSKCSHRVPQV